MNDNCYEIKIAHFYCLEYSEGERSMVLDIDFRDSIIYLNTALIVQWNCPHEKDIIVKEKKEEIIRRIFDHLVRKRGFNNVVLEMGGSCVSKCST